MKTKCPDELKPYLRRARIPLRAYLSHDAEHIYTTQATIVKKAQKTEPVNCGSTPGNNECGHRLPASGGME